MFTDDIIVLGAQGVGKTSLVLHYIHNRFIPSDIGVEDSYVKTIRGTTFKELKIFDTDSQDFYASSKRQQVLNTRGVVFCYAINDRHSFESCKDLYDRVHDLRKQMPDLVVVGLKSELEDERNIEYEEGLQYAQKIGAKFVESSSAYAVNVEDVFKGFESQPRVSKQKQPTTIPISTKSQESPSSNKTTPSTPRAHSSPKLSNKQVRKSTEQVMTSEVKIASNGKSKGNKKATQSKSTDSCCVIV